MATAAMTSNEVLARLAAVWPRETLSTPRVGLVTAHPTRKCYIMLHFRAAIDARMATAAMAASEVLARVADARPATC